MTYSTSPAYLVYRDGEGRSHHQSWAWLEDQGTLIDPDTGDDMPIVGWSVSEDTSEEVFTSEMHLVYSDDHGGLHYQSWSDPEYQGTLIDPDTGNDMPIIGWTERIR
jgi:hypothetical protein